ncbi:hypothetical protein [Legionella cardiaca]|uniref:Glutathione synthase/Ribosomal protein S6 modification enzyme (Glutaminyl transferase) n=1 Tax=Legionella cardiaca TaxID=1071983 RepID=A0ABY8ATW0_9GAMM|nr:hypothetical protein [Legionella cardiaca]WED42955.1 hypothetical protein PXX05_13785 [Legionella cardiaca]
MNILIATAPDDLHAQLVKLALEDKGHRCILWYMGDMPTKQKNSIYCENGHYSWMMENAIGAKTITENEIDVVWWRRTRNPFIPKTGHENDFDFIRKENVIFCDSIPLTLVQGPWWINPFDSIKYASSKVYQLKLAASLDFKIPATLISNAPEKIKEFIANNKNSQVIYKGFSCHHWCENNRLKLSYTKTVAHEQLPSDSTLQLTPGIYQEKLKKKYELRVTCFGDYLVAVKINSQEHAKGLNDWRVIPPGELGIEPYQLSTSIGNKIRGFMKRLGIVFGCFDFVVTPDDELYFLEVNQQGQFLWIEDLIPQIKMLDMFTNFLIQKTTSFNWKRDSELISLKNYEPSAIKKIDENMDNHIYRSPIKTSASF